MTEAKRPTIAAIQEEVAREFEVPLEALLSSWRTRPVAWPRQIAMLLAREMTGHSYPMIAHRFGRDHATIIKGSRKAKQRIAADEELAARVEAIRERLAA